MDHKKTKELVSSYLDAELDADTRQKVEGHLAACSECRAELEGMRKLKEVMGDMKLKSPPAEVWQVYWASVYNRLERRIGWILLSLGAIILLLFGGYKAVEGIIRDPHTPFLLKSGILLAMGGSAVLLVSVLRERLFVRRRERYKEIEK